MNKRIHVVVSGKVQGVFFRSNIKKMSDDLSVHGYAKNVGTDKVEAVFEGEVGSINKIVEFCKDGPEGAEVAVIIIDEESYSGEFKSFLIVD